MKYKDNNYKDDSFENEFEELDELEEFTEEDFDEDSSYLEDQYRRRKIFFRITGSVLLVVFVIFVLSNFLRIFTLPPLDFIHKSGELLEDPKISGLQKSVVQIQVDGGGGPGVRKETFRGSGFNIKEDGFIVTNRHVVENGSMMTVTFEEDGVYRVEEVIIPSTNLDLAFLRLQDANDLPSVKMSEDPNMSIDDEVIIIGNPLGFTRIAKEGKLVNVVKTGNAEPLLEVYAPIYPGSSGSPIFDDEGKVVGIIYAARKINEDEVRGIAFNTKEIIDVLKEKNILYDE
ncbi:S1 family peptidase [Natranaerofaba carboxydovora]|uniref:S1 family peptidase n=1 Tax=Natranaerofaba carboxydovora TaxID=2742683 RepID=UPI001F146C38|nr:serine protease [Natranaerofaba carboxydovora]UMZ74485.1 Serine protease Do-like HtrA [Natranaerofaba carboxydovora]